MESYLTEMVDVVVDAMCESGGYEKEVLMSNSQKESLCFARFCIFHTLRGSGLSTSKIGQIVNRDHATVLNGCKRFKQIIGNRTFPIENLLYYDFMKTLKRKCDESDNRSILCAVLFGDNGSGLTGNGIYHN